jgi:hypothetical protein
MEFIATTGSSYIREVFAEIIEELTMPTIPTIKANVATIRNETIKRGAIFMFFIDKCCNRPEMKKQAVKASSNQKFYAGKKHCGAATIRFD